MQEIIKKYEKKIQDKNAKRRKLKIVTAIASLAVVCIVLWALILPGVAMSGQPKCGKEEHRHSDACYTEKLTCGQKETDGHTHTDACYKTEKKLICGQEESETHQHTDACYQEEKTLICGKQEEAAHHHTAACYTRELTCGKEEHTHTDECYSDPTADVENEDSWTTTFRHAELGDDWDKNVAAIAETQIGYRESSNNYSVSENREHKGYTRYTAWYGDYYKDWDTAFAAFCIHYAGVPDDAFPTDIKADEWIKKLQEKDWYTDKTSEDYQVGDLIFLQKKNQETDTQVGVISKIFEKDGKTYIQTIEGNCDNQVKKNEYAADDENISGYGLLCKAQMKYKADQMAQENAKSEAKARKAAAKKASAPVQTQNADEGDGEDSAVFYSDDENAESQSINQGTTVKVAPKIKETVNNGEIQYVTVQVTDSSPNEQGDAHVKLEISELPEGVAIAGFENGKMSVQITTQDNNGATREATLTYDSATKKYCVELELPHGSTSNFDIQFNSKNGTMSKENTVTVTPYVVTGSGNNQVSNPAIIKWQGKHEWTAVRKNADKNNVAVDEKSNTFIGDVVYTIQAESQNRNSTGKIWTEEVQLKDTLTLPDGITFPDGAAISEDGTKVVYNGKTIFEFTDSQGGKVKFSNLTKNSVECEVVVPNKNKKDGTLTGEQDNLYVKAKLDVSKLKLPNNYAASDANVFEEDKIINHVDFESIPCKDYTHSKSNAEKIIKPSAEQRTDITKTAVDKNGKKLEEVKAGEKFTYKINVKNTGNITVKADDSENVVKDILPPYIEITEKQIAEWNGNENITYDAKTRTITWKPGTLKADEEKTLDVEVKVKDAESLKGVSNITNTARYYDKDASNTIKYKSPNIEIKKSNDADGTVKNGDEITYTVTIENREDTESIEQIITDKLPDGLVFEKIFDKDGNEVNNDSYSAESTNSKGYHEVSNWSINGQTITWKLGKLESGEKVTLKYVCKVKTDNANGSLTKLSNVASNGEKSSPSSDVDVKYPIDVDKKVKDGNQWTNGNGTYNIGEDIEYSVKVTNASGDAASKKDDLKITDTLPAGMVPSYTLYKDENCTQELEKTFEELADASKWEDSGSGLSDGHGEVGYVRIGEDVVKVTRQHNGGKAYNTFTLTWNIGSIPEGQSVEKKYKVKLLDKLIEGGYTNKVEVDGRTKEVTIYGKDSSVSSKIDLKKSVWTILDSSTGRDFLNSKSIFQQSDAQKNGLYVVYNISVINTGDNTVNIKELTDHMTDGLTYYGFNNVTDYNLYNVQNWKKEQITTNKHNVKNWVDLDSSILEENVSIKKKSVSHDEKNVEYQIGGDTGYNLDSGKAISFFVMCKVDKDAQVDVPLTNTADLTVDRDVQYQKYKDIKMKKTKDDTDQNLGTTTEKEKGNDRILSSSVTVKPQNVIVPGITKEAISYIPAGETTEVPITNKENIQPNVTVKWRVRLYNDGTVPIRGYKISDTVEQSFHIITKSEAEAIGKNEPFTLEVYPQKWDGTTFKKISEDIWNNIETTQKSNSFEINIPSGTCDIPAGGYAEVTIYTKNNKFVNSIYKNSATFIPNDTFDANKVKRGELITDRDGKSGVKAEDSVYAMGSFGSYSWKTIQEKDNLDNIGYGYKATEGQNYITVDNSGKKVIYTNNIDNTSTSDFKNISLVDLMPYIGDTGVINQSQHRNSQFSVKYNGGLKLYDVTDGTSQKVEISQDKYMIQFSDKTSFNEQNDFVNRTSSDWHTEWQVGDRSFRVLMNEDYVLQSKHTLVIEYEGQIEGDANPGTIAWNSFGYRYSAKDSTGTEKNMLAEPPKVGMKIKPESTIAKIVVDEHGNRLEADTNKKFKVSVYEGNSDNAGNLIKEIELYQGQAILLSNIKKADNTPVFVNGKTYTIVETDTNGTEFNAMGQNGDLKKVNKYTFKYYDADQISIIVENKLSGYELPSTGGKGTKGYLAGGAALMCLAALLYGYQLRRKRERGTM